MILCGGYNVYPRIVEEALYQHPAVAEAMVVGVPDAYRGQAPKAFVTLRHGHKATPEELRTFLAGYVSRIELPREVVIRRTLPQDHDRQALEKGAAGGRGGGRAPTALGGKSVLNVRSLTYTLASAEPGGSPGLARAAKGTCRSTIKRGSIR